ncbi:LUD domain-containing protein [Lacinutrix undariae]
MSLFQKFFGSKSKTEDISIQNEERGMHMPEEKLPVDERFTINFKENGGKFIYCEDLEEVHQSLANILNENGWEDEKALILDDRLVESFKKFNLNSSKQISESTYFLSTCEYLIADDGSLLMCSNQIAETKLNELPENFIIYATTSQFIENKDEVLSGIKIKNNGKIPTNITAIKHFKTLEDSDFLSYGSCSKNLYLLLLEDL